MKKLVFIFIISLYGLDMVCAGQFLKINTEIYGEIFQDTTRMRVSPRDLPKPLRDSLEIVFTDRNTRIVSAHQIYVNGSMTYEINVVEGSDNFIKQYDSHGRKLDEKEGDPELVRIMISPLNLPQPILESVDQHAQDDRTEIISAYQKIKDGRTIYVVNFSSNDEERTKVYDMHGEKLDVETEEIEKAGARKRIDERSLPQSVAENIEEGAAIRFAYQIREGDQLMYEVSYMENGDLKTILYDEDGYEIEMDEN